jgi:hypothetical protein
LIFEVTSPDFTVHVLVVVPEHEVKRSPSAFVIVPVEPIIAEYLFGSDVPGVETTPLNDPTI